MDITTLKDSRMYGFIVLYDMHTGFFDKVLDGISDKDAQNRLGTKANHIAWIAGSLLNERFEMAAFLGKRLHSSSHEFFKDHKGIQDNVEYPQLEDYKKDWKIISPVLREILVNADEKQLNTMFEMMPGMRMTHFELVSFMTYREANCIGQIALWRRLLGLNAMKYD